MSQTRLPLPEPFDLVPVDEVRRIIEATDRELYELEREATEAMAATEHAEDRLRDALDDESSAWAIARFQRYLDSLRAEAEDESRALLEIARRRAELILRGSDTAHTPPMIRVEEERVRFPLQAEALPHPPQAIVPPQVDISLRAAMPIHVEAASPGDPTPAAPSSRAVPPMVTAAEVPALADAIVRELFSTPISTAAASASSPDSGLVVENGLATGAMPAPAPTLAPGKPSRNRRWWSR